MRRIKELADQIKEELEGAKVYAEKSLDLKAHGDTSRAAKYKDMANDELKHALNIHDEAVDEIRKLSEIYTPPASMQEAWDLTHKEYIEKTAWIKTMLQM